MPVGILMANKLFRWHWVVGIGYRYYLDTEELYFQIADSWNDNSNRYYKPGYTSVLVSTTAYWVK